MTRWNSIRGPLLPLFSQPCLSSLSLTFILFPPFPLEYTYRLHYTTLARLCSSSLSSLPLVSSLFLLPPTRFLPPLSPVALSQRGTTTLLPNLPNYNTSSRRTSKSFPTLLYSFPVRKASGSIFLSLEELSKVLKTTLTVRFSRPFHSSAVF